MELGGFEPPTSWVRFTLLAAEHPLESRMTSGFAPLALCRRPSPICADMRRLSGFLPDRAIAGFKTNFKPKFPGARPASGAVEGGITRRSCRRKTPATITLDVSGSVKTSGWTDLTR